MTQGVYVPGGALNCTLNDATTKGAYMPNGSLRVTNVAGKGIYDSSGALRIVTAAGQGVYMKYGFALNDSDATADGLKGVYNKTGAIRMSGITAVVGNITLSAQLNNTPTSEAWVFM